MISTKDKTLGQIAAEKPSAVRVFEQRQIDYCCGGHRSIEDACKEKGISVEELLAEVEKATPSEETRDWAAASLTDLADHIIERHHTYLRSELPSLEKTIAKVIEAHGRTHSDSLIPLQSTFESLRDELGAHMMKEEVILFPLIRQMEAAETSGSSLPPAHCGSVNNPIGVMEQEHDNAAGALRKMRQVTAEYSLPPDACDAYRALFQGLQRLEADLHLHIHLENNVLFPRASRLEAELLNG